MRHVLGGLAAGLLACHAAGASAQQGSVQVFGAAQGLTGDPQRIAGENTVDPDFGVTWLQPGSRFGTFQIELRGTRRADRLHFGRLYANLRDLKFARLSWTVEGGDAYFTRSIGDYRFSNLTTPAVTFSGGAIAGRGSRGSLQIVGGRGTAWRNIFGSDPDTLAQALAAVHADYRVTDRLEVRGRASRIGTSGLKEFSFTIADSRQIGGGLRYTLIPQIQLIGDGGFVQYRRVGSSVQERDGSFLVGANVLLARGWLQVDASRFSPGEFPAMNDPLHDRETVFAAAEYDVWSRIRLFAGWEGFRTNIDPDITLDRSRDMPRNQSSRGFGGARFQIGERSIITVRAEDGANIARPIRGGLGAEFDSGSWSAEWHASFGSMTSHTRVSWRENVVRPNLEASYDQHDVSAQLFMRLSQTTQLFGLGTVTRHEAGLGAGSSYWQAGGGAQIQLPMRNLWLRGEATASRHVDLVTREFVPREAFNVGMTGQLAERTSLAVNFSADRTPLLFGGGTPWTTRSMVRITRTFSTGSVRVPVALTPAAAAVARSRGTGTVAGNIFTDWNQNGTHDPGEEPIENIPVRMAAGSSVTTAGDGEFAFLNVPAGRQQVGLDTSAVPIDFDPPAVSSVEIELDRGATRRVSFGLIPLGSVRGRVVRDANGNGRVDAGEEPLDGAILVLDNGARSEQVRKGVYRFDAVRSGEHVVALVRESLPEGAVIAGAPQMSLALTRGQLTAEIDFLVAVEKRPENRRVFPSRIGTPAPSPGGAASERSPARPPASPSAKPPTTSGIPRVPPLPATVRDGGGYAVQIAALSDLVRARALVRALTAAGYRAYVLEPAAGDHVPLYRVRVGGYRARAAATAAAGRLERLRREKVWVVRETAVAPR
ncbi:MAG: SPOR domain-containing protein [Vicinamibacterales bacterium]